VFSLLDYFRKEMIYPYLMYLFPDTNEVLGEHAHIHDAWVSNISKCKNCTACFQAVQFFVTQGL